MVESPPILTLRTDPNPSRAALRVRADIRSPHPVPARITGKFCEHLGSNIYNGMLAQITRNPTFAEWYFRVGSTPDGRGKFQCDEEKIAADLRAAAARLKWPEDQIERLIESRADSFACWWVRLGSREAVRVSPDTGPHGGRAQRVEVRSAGEGIAQWTHLPLHRVRKYEYEIVVRSPNLPSLSVSLLAPGSEKPAAEAPVTGISPTWRKFRGTLELPASCPAKAIYRLAVTAPAQGQFVVGRVLLWPVDNVGGADPDVVRLLKESHLPILRWPGGNFVSGYHWEDGIGPADGRPTRPNWAWGGVEPNLFGTDEFIAFCRAAGCEPMVCLNAGDGTPQEAARWVEYCNGPAGSPMGARRAAGGHPEPFHVRHWEIGNEIYGRWQTYWTTPQGYADRYREFSRAMLAADPSIRLYACGAPVLHGEEWNRALFAAAAPDLRCTTDHPLLGRQVTPSTDPMDVYRDFMAFPVVMERKWAELRAMMLEAGVEAPRLAITELQLFAHLSAEAGGGPVRLTRENLVSPATLAEALYDTLLYHAAVRLAPFVEMVTHSATVNHGGGLRKERERVYANPCHYAQAAFAAFAGAAPVAVELSCPTERAALVLTDLKGAAGAELVFSAIDALAAIAADGSMLVSIVHRGTSGPIRTEIDIEGFQADARAEVRTLSGQVPWAANTLETPEAVRPVESTAEVRGGKLSLDLQPYGVTRIRIPPGR